MRLDNFRLFYANFFTYIFSILYTVIMVTKLEVEFKAYFVQNYIMFEIVPLHPFDWNRISR